MDAGARRVITGNPIPPLIPSIGDVRVLIVGEAPGPRGADKSGVPFFGDAAGKHLYRALRNIGAVNLACAIDGVKWDGLVLRSAGFAPVAQRVSLTNAFDRCPSDDGAHFRSPTRAELESTSNVQRLVTELHALQSRGLTGIVTLGKVAERTMRFVLDRALMDAPIHALPHPSAQGLLSMAENRGRGARMADLQTRWIAMCADAVCAAGYVRAQHELTTTVAR